MKVTNHMNFKYSGTIPENTNDRYTAQDLLRDFWHQYSKLGQTLKAIYNENKLVISGLELSKGSATEVNITAGKGYAPYTVEIPLDISTLPGTKQTFDVEAITIELETTEVFDCVNATFDDVSTNYIKLAYAETDGLTRNRQFGAGTYSFETIPGFLITVDTTVPTAYEIELGRFVSVGGELPVSFDTTSRDQLYASTFKEVSENIFPVGASYIQLPGGSAPGSFLPGTWTAQFETEGVFFRTPGGEALAFEGGLQEFAFEDHNHFVDSNLNEGGSFAGVRLNTGVDGASSFFQTPMTGYVGTPNTATETRPRNRTVRVWLRTA